MTRKRALSFRLCHDPTLAAIQLRRRSNNPLRDICFRTSRAVDTGLEQRIQRHSFEELRRVEDSLGYAAIVARGVVGKGLNNYPRIFQILREAGYEGWISIEDGLNGLEEIKESALFALPDGRLRLTWNTGFSLTRT